MSNESVGMSPGSRFGAYEICRALGRGSFGAVYEALKLPLRKRVALKVLHTTVAANADAVARFHREAEAAARLRHPHIVDVHDLGEVDGAPFIAMEYLDGENLSSRLGRVGRMAPHEAVDLLLPILSAVASAHDAGVIHRDLKPDNIFVSQSLGVDVPKLLDFGIAKVFDASDAFKGTATTAILGTPYYMSPEQVRRSRDVDARSDQWSLAVILRECLTGVRPFDGESLYELFNKIVAEPLAPLSVAAPWVPAGVAAVIERAMTHAPDARFPTVRAMGAALLPFASPRVRDGLGRDFSHSMAPPGVAASPLQQTIVGTPTSPFVVSTLNASAREVPKPTASKKGRALFVSAALVVGVALVATAAVALDDAPPAARAPVASPAALSPAQSRIRDEASRRLAAGRPPAPAPTPAVELVIRAYPPTATIAVDGAPLGVGAARRVYADGRLHAVVVSAAGFQPQSFSFQHVAPPPDVRLAPVEAPRAPEPVAALPAQPAQAVVAPPARNTRRSSRHGASEGVVEPRYERPVAVQAPPSRPERPTAPAQTQPASGQVFHRSGGLSSSEF